MSKTTPPKKILDPELSKESSSDNPAEVNPATRLLSSYLNKPKIKEETAKGFIEDFLQERGDTKENRKSVEDALEARFGFEGKDDNKVPNDLKFSLKLVGEYGKRFEETKISYTLPKGIDSKTFDFRKHPESETKDPEKENIASVVTKKGLSKKLASLGSAIIGRIKQSVGVKKKAEISSGKGNSR
jgi:hypothetical protein